MAEHHCHARGCTTPVEPERLMCPRHWFRVAQRIRTRVWETYRPGQCEDKAPSSAWHEAADAAIGFVAGLEGKPITPSEVKALEALGYEVKDEFSIPRVVLRTALATAADLTFRPSKTNQPTKPPGPAKDFRRGSTEPSAGPAKDFRRGSTEPSAVPRRRVLK